MPNAQEAFHWIVNFLENHVIRFQITGGVAAQAYGALRPLADIDIIVAENDLGLIHAKVKQFIEFGPARYHDENWDLLLLTLNYQGQLLDLGGAFEAKIYDCHLKRWERLKTDFSTSVIREVFGRPVPVISKTDLIRYKTALSRDVDLEDLVFLTSIG